MKRIFSLFLCAALCVAMLSSCGASAFYDYRGRDLSSYIDITAADCSGLVISVAAKKTVTRDDAVLSIREMLYEDIPYQVYTNAVVEEGDTLVFRYRVSYNGQPVNELSNYAVGDAATLVLSTDAEKRTTAFIKGCDDEIVSALLREAFVPNNYYIKENKLSTVAANDIIYATVEGTYVGADGTTKVYKTTPYARIDLSDADGEYAEYYSLIEGAAFGETKISPTAEYIGEGVNELVTFKFTPQFRLEDERTITLTVTLPEGFDEGGSLSYLRGKTVTLDIVPVELRRDELPALTLELMKTATAGEIEDEEDLESFIDYWRQYKQAEEDAAYETRLATAIDKVFLTDITVKEYPADAVSSALSELEGSLSQAYDSYVSANGSAKFPTLADYRRAALECDTDAEADAEMERLAKESVAEYLKIFAAAKALSVVPTDAEVDEVYAEWRLSLGESESDIAAYEAVYDAYYGEGYLRSFVTFSMTKDSLYKKIAELAVFVEPAE